jgi:hypothetical protein
MALEGPPAPLPLPLAPLLSPPSLYKYRPRHGALSSLPELTPSLSLSLLSQTVDGARPRRRRSFVDRTTPVGAARRRVLALLHSADPPPSNSPPSHEQGQGGRQPEIILCIFEITF